MICQHTKNPPEKHKEICVPGSRGVNPEPAIRNDFPGPRVGRPGTWRAEERRGIYLFCAEEDLM